MITTKLLSVTFILLLLHSGVANSDISEVDELSMSYGDEDFVSIATGRKQPISKAPAVSSVITADDIKKVGARDLVEALEVVPGLHVSMRAAGYNPIFVMRGVYSEVNPQVLMLINGVPITNVFAGDRSQIWGGHAYSKYIQD